MSPTRVNPFNFIIPARKLELVCISKEEVMAMVNNYEAPEMFDLGKTKEVILGEKTLPNRDPETGEPEWDEATEDQFM